MSGSGNSGYSGGNEDFQDNCENLAITTQLSSPKDEVIQLISEGDILDVSLLKSEQTTVVVALFNGQVAGGIASPQIHRLRSCIEQGTEYVAKVLSISGGQVKVLISAKRNS